MTSFNRSFQLSPYKKSVGVKENAPEGSRTFPLGGLVNHKVHLCIRGCLTLKLSLSWKTVICSSPVAASLLGFLFSSRGPSGEMGIVERSTGSEAAAAAMMSIIDRCSMIRDVPMSPIGPIGFESWASSEEE